MKFEMVTSIFNCAKLYAQQYFPTTLVLPSFFRYNKSLTRNDEAEVKFIFFGGESSVISIKTRIYDDPSKERELCE
jgi:hypothetical protein